MNKPTTAKKVIQRPATHTKIARDNTEDTPLGDRPKGNPAAARQAAFERRRFIYEKVRRETRVSFDELKQAYGTVTKAIVADDIRFFNSLGVKLKFMSVGDQQVIADEEVRYRDDYGIHQGIRLVEKRIVAKVAASLIAGRNTSFGERGLAGQSEIQGALKTQNLEKMSFRLPDIWRESSRLISLDSSTTNELVAHELTLLKLPSPDSSLSYVSVCTNGTRIFSRIARPDVRIRAIITGGQQRAPSSTLAGALTELFLRHASLLHFGFSFVSATGVCVADAKCLADTQEDMVLKQLFLEKATNRVIIVDNSKLRKPLQRDGFAFASLNPEQVDLLITNSPLSIDAFQTFCSKSGKTPTEDEVAEQKQAIREFPGFIQDLRKRKIGVLVGETDFTAKTELEHEKVQISLSFNASEMAQLHTMPSLGSETALPMK